MYLSVCMFTGYFDCEYLNIQCGFNNTRYGNLLITWIYLAGILSHWFKHKIILILKEKSCLNNQMIIANYLLQHFTTCCKRKGENDLLEAFQSLKYLETILFYGREAYFQLMWQSCCLYSAQMTSWWSYRQCESFVIHGKSSSLAQ